VKSFAGWFVFFAALIAGCPKPVPSPVTPPDASDAAPAPPPASCAEACANIRRLGCKNPDSCSNLCPRVLSGRYRTCVARATSCDAVTNCDQGVGNQ
jgi:hypothetical protein